MEQMEVVNNDMSLRINSIREHAEHELGLLTGKMYRLVPVMDVEKSAMALAHDIAKGVGMEYNDLLISYRGQDYVRLRQITCLILRDTFPLLTLVQLGRITGYREHTAVMHSLFMARKRIFTKEKFFCETYNQALKVAENNKY